jgi:Right handed beta helix region
MNRHLMPALAMLASGANAIRTLALLLVVIAAGCVGAAPAHAQNSRSWVSATGTDTSNTQCSVTAPCLTFAHAIAETASGGEINCLTPGGFGSVTITISVTIDCEGVSNGGIQSENVDDIAINTAGINVNLIGLDINGNGNEANGVSITAAAHVLIRNCKIYGFGGNEGYGIYFWPSFSGSSGGTLVVDNTFIANNGTGIWLIGQSGVSNMTVRNSNINNNTYGIFVESESGAHSGATIEQTTLAFNYSDGFLINGTGAIAVIGGSTVVNNTNGVVAQSGSIIYSFKNNQIGGNSSDGTPLTAYPGGPLN